MEEAGKSLAQSGRQSGESYLLQDILMNPEIQTHLRVSNIFIFGKVGFFDVIQKSLFRIILNKKKQETLFVRSLVDLKSIKNNKERNPSTLLKSPLLLMPTAKNKEDLNQLVSVALELIRPIWLVALPSQIEKHLLSSFSCFFIAPHSAAEITWLSDIISILNEDVEKLCQEAILQAILFIDRPTLLGQPNRLGSVIYIEKLAE